MKAVLVSVGTSATAIVSGVSTSNVNPRACTVTNPASASVTVYVGGPDVDITNGWPLVTLDLVLDPGEILYGVVASGTQNVNVLRNGE